MRVSCRLRTGALALSLTTFAAGTCLHATEARADEKQACVASHAASQRLRQQSKLREARRELALCARASCPPAVVADCEPWLDEVTRLLPTIVVTFRDSRGEALGVSRVLVDGEVVADPDEGRPIEIDPGRHELRCEAPGGHAATVLVDIRAGEKARAIRVDLDVGKSPAPKPAPKEEPPQHTGRGVPMWAAILGGVGLVALGGFAYLAIDGRSTETHLENTC